MAQQDEEVTRLADEAQARRKQDETVQPAADMPLIAKLLIVGVASYFLFYTDMLQWSKTAKFIALMVVMFAVFFISARANSPREIPEEQVAAIAYKRLLFYQTHRFGDNTRLPAGRIKLNPVGVPQFESWDGDKMKWWNHSFTIRSQIGSDVFKGIIRTHPVSGFSRGIVSLDGEYLGNEEPNIKFVGREDLAKTKWARDKLNQFPPFDSF